MLRPLSSVLILLVLGFAMVVPSAGCGAKKRAATVTQRIASAKKLPTAEARAAELSKIASMRAEAKDRKGAEEILGEALAEVPEDGQPLICVPILLEIADTYIGIGQKTTARKAVELASKLTSTVEDPKARVTLLAQVGTLQGSRETGLGDSRGAKRLLDEAAKLATEDVTERFRAGALAPVAMGYADAGLASDAATMIGTLEELAEALTDLRTKAEAFAAAAAVRAALGEKEAAAALLEKAGAAAKAIKDLPANRVYALVAVAKALVATGDKKGALVLLADADKSASKVPDPEAQKAAIKTVRVFQARLER
jgi:tetratricopeptide (TPR) repeat protein